MLLFTVVTLIVHWPLLKILAETWPKDWIVVYFNFWQIKASRCCSYYSVTVTNQSYFRGRVWRRKEENPRGRRKTVGETQSRLLSRFYKTQSRLLLQFYITQRRLFWFCFVKLKVGSCGFTKLKVSFCGLVKLKVGTCHGFTKLKVGSCGLTKCSPRFR